MVPAVDLPAGNYAKRRKASRADVDRKRRDVGHLRSVGPPSVMPVSYERRHDAAQTSMSVIFPDSDPHIITRVARA